MLKDCSPEKVKFIAKVIKPIIEYKEKWLELFGNPNGSSHLI
jgi:hypothetical protein